MHYFLKALAMWIVVKIIELFDGSKKKHSLKGGSSDGGAVPNSDFMTGNSFPNAMLSNGDDRQVLTIQTRDEQTPKKTGERFRVTDLVIIDTEANNVWTRNAFMAGETMSWDKGENFIKGLNDEYHAGYHSWRMPSREDFEELMSCAQNNEVPMNIHEYLSRIAVNVQSFPYWTSSPENGGDVRCHINLSNGATNHYFTSGHYHIWAVADDLPCQRMEAGYES